MGSEYQWVGSVFDLKWRHIQCRSTSTRVSMRNVDDHWLYQSHGHPYHNVGRRHRYGLKMSDSVVDVISNDGIVLFPFV